METIHVRKRMNIKKCNRLRSVYLSEAAAISRAFSIRIYSIRKAVCRQHFPLHTVVHKHYIAACPNPCKRCGNTYSCVSPQGTDKQCASNTHHQFNHTGDKRCRCILHTLNGTAVDTERSQYQIAGGHPIQITI